MLGDLFLLLILAFSTLLFQLLGLPLILLWLGRRESQPEWWAWGRLVGWLVLGLAIWWLAHIGLPVNTTAGFWLIFILLAGGVYLTQSLDVFSKVREFFRKHRRLILIQELIFLSGFIFLGLVRTYHPSLNDLEKFMDAGLMASYLRSPTLPAEDMWLAGETINYYTFGHFLGSLLLRFWVTPVESGFNVALGFIMGLILLQTFSLCRLWLRPFLTSKSTERSLMVGGLVATAAIGFGGNTHLIWFWLKNHNFTGYWYPDATRFITNTIHEFPAYSFIVSDLHAHVWSLPLVLLFLAVAWRWCSQLWSVKKFTFQHLFEEKSFLLSSAILGGLLGVLGMTSTWDMLIYGLVTGILAIIAFVNQPKRWLLLGLTGLVAAVTALVVLLPWWLNFTSISEGVKLVTERSPVWQLLVLWSGHVILSALALVVALIWQKRNKRNSWPSLFLVGLALTAGLLLILPELIYFKDIYPTHPRANTMFKLTFQAFLIMTLMIGWLSGLLVQSKSFLQAKSRWLMGILVIGFLLATLPYAYFGYRDYYGAFKQRQSLDGLAWLYRQSPTDYAAVHWLRANALSRPVVLEAVGESYTDFARVSAFTGLPTVLGWRVHEWLWRGGFDIPGARTEEVKTIYEQPLGFEAQRLLSKYQVRYIMIGAKERETYQLDLNGLSSLGSTVFQSGDTLIVQRN